MATEESRVPRKRESRVRDVVQDKIHETNLTHSCKVRSKALNTLLAEAEACICDDTICDSIDEIFERLCKYMRSSMN